MKLGSTILSASNTKKASYCAFSSIFCFKNQSNAKPFVFLVSSNLSYTIAPASFATFAVLSVQLSAITYISVSYTHLNST